MNFPNTAKKIIMMMKSLLHVRHATLLSLTFAAEENFYTFSKNIVKLSDEDFVRYDVKLEVNIRVIHLRKNQK